MFIAHRVESWSIEPSTDQRGHWNKRVRGWWWYDREFEEFMIDIGLKYTILITHRFIVKNLEEKLSKTWLFLITFRCLPPWIEQCGIKNLFLVYSSKVFFEISEWGRNEECINITLALVSVIRIRNWCAWFPKLSRKISHVGLRVLDKRKTVFFIKWLNNLYK